MDTIRIPNVKYRNNIYQIELQTEKSGPFTPDQAISFYSKTDFKLPSSDLVYAILRSAVESKDNELIYSLRRFLHEKGLLTSTRLIIPTEGLDTIIHDYKMPNELKVHGDFVGPDIYTKESLDPRVKEEFYNAENPLDETELTKFFSALLGTNNLKEILNVFKRINNTSVLRTNRKPKQLEEKIVTINGGIEDNRFNLWYGPDHYYCTFGVRMDKLK
ncbi:MAG: hypothetical protein PHF86_03620 [Candidatus Nanoarchaeia archaeon]|nr:hypothetical protein [Candidatus Nanoarchaeia archaeon]